MSVGLPTHRVLPHPGEILLREFLEPLGLTQVAFAKHLGIPLQRLNQVVKGKRAITPETALLLSEALGTTAQFWLNMQNSHDLTKEMQKAKRRHVKRIPRPDLKAA